MIENGTIESVAGTLLKGSPVAMAILALLLAFLIRYRTNSTHTIFRWLWRRIAGKAKGNDAAFNEFMDAQDNLMQFVFISGKTRTVAQMHSLINWARSHNEDIRDIHACGQNFDRELPGLKAPDKRPTSRALGWLKMRLLGVSILLIINTLFATVPGAVVVVKDTKKWLIVGTKSTRSVVNPGAERLIPDQCSQPMERKIKSSGFTARDVTVICELYANPESTKFVKQTIWEQRLFFGIFVLVFLCFFRAMYGKLVQGSAAVEMAIRLDRPRP
jgi:hypothetical protein